MKLTSREPFWLMKNGITFSIIGMDMLSNFLKEKSHPLDEYWKFKR